jgi:hypothetical protein
MLRIKPTTKQQLAAITSVRRCDVTRQDDPADEILSIYHRKIATTIEIVEFTHNVEM